MPKIENLNIIFKDEQGTDLNKYGITESNGLEKQVKLRRLANITQVGTPLNAKNLNLLKDKINEVVNKANTNETEIDNTNQAITDKVKQTLKEAKTYTDSLETKVSETYETKTDATAKLASAKSYSDTNKQKAITSANSYTDTKVKKAIEDLNTSGDTNLGLAKAYTDQKVSEGVKEAKSYTDKQFKKINDNLIATVDCTHQYEITGNTGDEHGLAIDDQQMLIKKIQGHSRRKSLNLFDINKTNITQLNNCEVSKENNTFVIKVTNQSDPYFFIDNNGFDLIDGKTYYYNFFKVSSNKNARLDFWGLTTAPLENPFVYSKNVGYHFEIEDYEVGNTYKFYFSISEKPLEIYTPYDNTLVNSNNTLISTGRNILNPDDFGAKCHTYDKATGIATINVPRDTEKVFFENYYFAPNTQYTIILDAETEDTIALHSTTNLQVIYTDGTSGSLVVGTNTTNGKSIKCIERNFFDGSVTTFKVNNCAIIKGANQDFEPYKQDIVQAPSLGEFDYYQEGKIYRQTSQVITLNGSESWKIEEISPSKRFIVGLLNQYGGCLNDNYTINTTNNLGIENQTTGTTWTGTTTGISAEGDNLHLIIEGITTVEQLKEWLKNNNIQMVFRLATPTIEDYAMPSGYAVYNGGLQIQQGDLPYTITKQYNLSQKAQILANIEVDREQAKMIDEVNNKIINLPSPSITNRTVKNISINNTFPQTLTSEQTKDVFNNDLFVILSVGGSQNFYEYKNVIENPIEGKTFINISPGMKDSVSENVSFDVLYVESNGYIRKESFQINKFPVYQHSILITDEKDIRILCSIVAKRGRAISEITELKDLIDASGLKVVCNGFVKPTLGRQGGMAFELNTQSADVKVKYVDLSSNSNSIYDVALNSISNLKIIDTVYDYTVANG